MAGYDWVLQPESWRSGINTGLDIPYNSVLSLPLTVRGVEGVGSDLERFRQPEAGLDWFIRTMGYLHWAVLPILENNYETLFNLPWMTCVTMRVVVHDVDPADHTVDPLVVFTGYFPTDLSSSNERYLWHREFLVINQVGGMNWSERWPGIRTRWHGTQYVDTGRRKRGVALDGAEQAWLLIEWSAFDLELDFLGFSADLQDEATLRIMPRLRTVVR